MVAVNTSANLNNHFDDKMILIEKYQPEKVYSVVHFEGKSKNYMIKRFKFELTSLGKQTSIISDESGSKLVIISGAQQPVITVEQLKGKTEIPETVELNLFELIDVKGMKAMGNRISQHPVKSVALLAEIEPEIIEEEIITEEEASEETPNIPSVESPETESVESPNPESPHKKIDFEITNPDDLDIDDKGQIGLF